MARSSAKHDERVAVFFNADQLAKVKAEAEKQGLSVSAYIRMVVLWEVCDNG